MNCAKLSTNRNVPIAKLFALRTGVSIIKANSLFTIPYYKWRAKSSANCTIAKFTQTHTHLHQAEHEYKHVTIMGNTGYYHSVILSTVSITYFPSQALYFHFSQGLINDLSFLSLENIPSQIRYYSRS